MTKLKDFCNQLKPLVEKLNLKINFKEFSDSFLKENDEIFSFLEKETPNLENNLSHIIFFNCLPYFIPYIKECQKYSLSLYQGQFLLIITNKNGITTSFVFNQKGIIDFTSLDQDVCLEDDSFCYVLKGSISMNKFEKIKRLLITLD